MYQVSKSHHRISAQMQIQEQLSDWHIGSQPLHQQKTAWGSSLNQGEVLWSLTSALKRTRISFRTQAIFVNSHFRYSLVQREIDYLPCEQRDSRRRPFSCWFAGIPLPGLQNGPRGTPASQSGTTIFQLLDRPSTKQDACCVFPLYTITTTFNCLTFFITEPGNVLL